MPDLTARAEEAFLGAVISDPFQLEPLHSQPGEQGMPPVRVSDFTSPARASVWAAIMRVSDIAPGATGPEMISVILAATDDPLVTRDYLDRLALSAPTPSAARVYARMISEAALVRDLADAAGSTAPGGTPDDADPSVRAVTALAANLTAARAAPAEDMTSPGPPPDSDRVELEEQFLAGLLARQAVTDWITLDPAIFTGPGLREIYATAVSVDSLGEPVDDLTLAWAAARAIAVTDTAAGQSTTQESLAGTIPPGTIARLAATPADPLTALQAGRALLAENAITQITARASAARDADPARAPSPQRAAERALGNGHAPPLLRPPAEQQQRPGRQVQEGS
jgi:replicative DNA helicase